MSDAGWALEAQIRGVSPDMSEVEHVWEPGTEDEHAAAINAMRSVSDPEIPLNIYDLGLIYRVETIKGGKVKVRMTLTSPSCPEAESLPGKVIREIEALPGIEAVELDLTWDPPWGPDRMSDEVKLQLGFY